MVVEPERLCWLTGRMVTARDGVTWAEGFTRFPALRSVVRDDGTGLGKGVRLERARRRGAGRPDLDDTLDVFHTLREGGRALRTTWGAASRALERADAAQKDFDRRGRQGRSRQGHGAPLNRLWRQAERLWDRATAADTAWKQARSAFEFFTPEGRLDDRVQAAAVVAAGRRGGAAALDRRGVGQDPASVAPPGEFYVPGSSARAVGRVGTGPRRLVGVVGPGRSAPPALASIGRHPRLGDGSGGPTHEGMWRLARDARRVRAVLRGVWRASSLVECVHSVARMQQARHRKMTPELLDLKRLPRNSPTAGASGQCR